MFFNEDLLVQRCKELKEYSALKALIILEVLSSRNTYMSIGEISALSSLSASTVHRVVMEMVESGYVKKSDDHKYKLGHNSFALGLRFNNADYLVEASLDEMKRLNDLSGETIHLIFLNRFEGKYIAKLEAKNPIGLRSQIGWSIPLHCTGGGKALLAYQNDNWLKAYFKENLMKSFTKNTISTEDSMKEEIQRIKGQGYAIDNREHNPDVVCIACPIFDSEDKAICSISISSPDYRFPIEKALSFASEIIKSAQKISQSLKTR